MAEHLARAFLAIAAVGCSLTPSPPSEPFGLQGPVLVQAASFRWRWVSACFASQDTDGDGSTRILVGPHGDVHGDESELFLMLRGSRAEPIEQFLGSSPSGRLLGVVVRHHLWLIDADTNQRWDLSARGAAIPPDGSAVLPHPAIGFSTDGRVAFVRRGPGPLELVVLDPRSGEQTTVFSTEDEIARFDFEGRFLQVRTLPEGVVDRSSHTNLAPRPCRGAPASYLTFRTGADPTSPVTVPVPKSSAQVEPIERVLSVYRMCTLDGLPAVASSADETQQLLASSFDGFWAERGPLRWGHGEVHRNHCPRNASE
jgi:hypothetical protein